MKQQRHSDVSTMEAAAEQTRLDIAATLTALQYRLQPQNILKDARDAVLGSAHDATAQATQSIIQTVQDMGSQLQGHLQDTPLVASVLEALVGWLSTFAHQAGNLQHTVSGQDNALGQASEHIQERAKELATDASQQAQQQVEHAIAQIEQLVKDNPWMLGLLVAATGAAIGIALPETSQERGWYSHTRDAIGQQLRSMLDDALGTAKAAAKTVQTTVQDGMQAQPDAATPAAD